MEPGSATFSDGLVNTLTGFLSLVEIPAVPASSLEKTVFPGLDIQHGCVLIDESRLVYPGDILHEAGHLAVTTPQHRRAARLAPSGGEELCALAWSYAAALHLGLDPATVFYPASYHGLGDELARSFAEGKYIGVPLLQCFGMTLEPKRARDASMKPFPHMLRWLR
jgi:hypothetical protein